ncbi:MAG TPA: ABC transporter permease subunit, partial [Burkholderiaceae bacterium]|nr:ABC transporter permease subunit [Burkholderiaceae bacterium]
MKATPARWLWLLPATFLVGLLLAPLARLLIEGGATDLADWAWWQDDHLRWRMGWSVLQATATCALVLVLGLPVAWVLARVEFAGRRWVLRVLMLPFVVPTLVAAMGVLALLGPRGWAGQMGVDLEETPWLLLYGNLFFNLCVLVRTAVEALERVSAQRLAAARTLGATPWRAFWRIEWPAIVPAVGAALCLVFLYCFAGFGLALVLGGQRYATVEVEIYTLVAHELQLAQAGTLALWTLGGMSAVALVYVTVSRHLAAPERADRVPRLPLRGAAL